MNWTWMDWFTDSCQQLLWQLSAMTLRGNIYQGRLNWADVCREQVATISHFWKSPKYSWTYIEHTSNCLWRQLLWQLSAITLRVNIYQGELNWADACREQVATSHFWKSPKYSWTYIEHTAIATIFFLATLIVNF